MTTETLRGEMRCSHIDERSAEEGLGALLAAHGCVPPRHLYFPSGSAKAPLHLETSVHDITFPPDRL